MTSKFQSSSPISPLFMDKKPDVTHFLIISNIMYFCVNLANVLQYIISLYHLVKKKILNVPPFNSKKGFNVRSFGTGDKVKLPGPAPDRPNCYEFGTSYETIYQDLQRKDKALYVAKLETI